MIDQMDPKYPLKTLCKAIEILEYMKNDDNAEGVTLAALSKQLNMSKSSVHRILDTLLSYNVVEKSGTAIVYYRLSWAIYRIGNKVPGCHMLKSFDYKSLIDALAEKTGHEAYICIKENESTRIIYRSIPSAASHVGILSDMFRELLPLYATASGKLFMLDFKKEEILHYFQTTDIRRYTGNTILNYIDFQENLEEIRVLGYAFDDHEYETNRVYIAKPIKDYSGKTVAAISIMSERETETEAEMCRMLPELSSACSVISAYLGYAEGIGNDN